MIMIMLVRIRIYFIVDHRSQGSWEVIGRRYEWSLIRQVMIRVAGRCALRGSIQLQLQLYEARPRG